ncbi:MAG TPA: AsmA family protein [Terriglobales bacterium]|nr:AsmA family protein [Terriglobales bacterium]
MKRAIQIIGIILGLLLIAAIALPFLIDVNSFRPRLESELSTALGRQVKVGNLKLSILSGSVAAEDLSVADDASFSKGPFIRAKSLDVGVDLMPLIFSKALHVNDLTLTEPEIVLLRTSAGKWNFSSLGGNSPAKEKPSSSQGSSNPNLSVGKLEVKNGRVTVGEAGSATKPKVYDKVGIVVRNFSFASQFPFTMTANLPAGGNLKLDGRAGPIAAEDASLTPLEAKIGVKKLDLPASGFVEPASGIAGVMDFDGTLKSDGKNLNSNGNIVANKLKLSPKGSPAGREVDVKYSLVHDLQKQAGAISQAEISMGKALAQLNGNYQMQGNSTLVNMKLIGQGMPVDELEAMLPAVGVILPSGSSLKGGTLSTTLGISGPTDKLVIVGPVRLADSKLAGFDLGSKLSAISALGGAKTGSDTVIQNLSTNARVAPEGIKTDDVNLMIPSLGTLTGAGTISPAGALDYRMQARLSGAAAGLTQVAGLGGGGAVPFFIRGTTSSPQFVPDVQGMVAGRLKGGLPGVGAVGGNSPLGSLGGLFGKKKKKP